MVSKSIELPTEQSPMRELVKIHSSSEKKIINQNTNTSAGKESSTTGQ